MKTFGIAKPADDRNKKAYLHDLDYGVVVEHVGSPCLVVYDGESRNDRGLVSLSCPLNTFSFNEGPPALVVLGKLRVTLDDFHD